MRLFTLYLTLLSVLFALWGAASPALRPEMSSPSECPTEEEGDCKEESKEGAEIEEFLFQPHPTLTALWSQEIPPPSEPLLLRLEHKPNPVQPPPEA